MAGQRRPEPTKTTSAPRFVAGLSVSPRDVSRLGAEKQTHIEWDRAALSYTFRDHNCWSKPKTVQLYTQDDLWHCLGSLPRKYGNPYIVAPRAHDALTLAGFWERIETGTITLRKVCGPKADPDKPRFHPLIVSKGANVVGWTHRNRHYRCVSADNLSKVTLAQMAESLGWHDRIPLGDAGSLTLPQWDCTLVAEICRAWTQWQIDWWTKNQCGSWGDTQGVSSMNTFRSHGTPRLLRTHDHPCTTELESAACYGGRVAVFFGGTIGSKSGWEQFPDAPRWLPKLANISEPLIRFDVRSMYPAILRDKPFPVALLHRSNECTVDQLAASCYSNMVIAAVRVKSRRGETPRRTKCGTEYPAGIFDTTLATPDLLECLRHNEVIKVYCQSVYKGGSPFKTWANWMLNARTVQRGDGNLAGIQLVKSLANALSGKLGSKKSYWRSTDSEPARVQWGEWTHVTAENLDGTRYRALGGQVQEWVESETRNGLLAACYAHITSYGRIQMAQTRALLGDQSAVWQDTDGIVVRQSACERMALTGGLDSGNYGTFRTEETAHNVYYYGPKAYWRDGDWIVSGIHNTWRIIDDDGASEVRIANPASTANKPVGGRLLCSVQYHDLNDLSKMNKYYDNGWLKVPATMMLETDKIDRTACPQLLGYTGVTTIS